MSEELKEMAPEASQEGRNSCEHCLCCSCERTCMRCGNCSPMAERLVPLIGCRDYIDMRCLKPLRYLYRGEAGIEYKLHTPRS